MADNTGTGHDVKFGVEWVQVKPHGSHKRQTEGWIPRSVLEMMGIDCSPLDRQVVGISGRRQGTVWFTAEQAEAIHSHPDYHDGPLPEIENPVSHSPGYPFGCNATWGDSVRDGGIHVCNLSNTHFGNPHECKCGEISSEPKPIPGPPPPPKCIECGRVVGHRGHAPDCQRGTEFARRAQVHREIEGAITIAIRARRQDVEFMDRLHARIKVDGVVLERLAEEDA